MIEGMQLKQVIIVPVLALLLFLAFLVRDGLPYFLGEPLSKMGDLNEKARRMILVERNENQQRIFELRQKETTLIANESTRQIEFVAGRGVATTTRTEGQLADTVARLGRELYSYVLSFFAFLLLHTIVFCLVLAYLLYKVVRFVFALLTGSHRRLV